MFQSAFLSNVFTTFFTCHNEFFMEFHFETLFKIIIVFDLCTSAPTVFYHRVSYTHHRIKDMLTKVKNCKFYTDNISLVRNSDSSWQAALKRFNLCGEKSVWQSKMMSTLKCFLKQHFLRTSWLAHCCNESAKPEN
jgi:hypothetical protein